MAINEVACLLDDLGRSLTIRKKTTGAYDPATSSATLSNTDVSAFGCLLNYGDKERDGSMIQAGDRKAVIKAKDIASAPEINDFIVYESKEYKIVNVRQIEESGVDIAYICQVRG